MRDVFQEEIERERERERDRERERERERGREREGGEGRKGYVLDVHIPKPDLTKFSLGVIFA